MINLFVTYRCNLRCPYCFARELRREHPEDLSVEDFSRFLEWMRRAELPALAFIGGEPTLHPRLPGMLKAARETGAAVVLFTNALFPPELAARIAPHVSNFVVNYNDPSLYDLGQLNRLHINLQALHDMGARLTFSKNFTASTMDYDYLLDGARMYGVQTLRYDISRPGLNGTNDSVDQAGARTLLHTIVGFVKACDADGIRTGMDCCVRPCDFPVEDGAFMREASMKLTSICHPSVDVHPDLSASYCLPMHDLRLDDITLCRDQAGAIQQLAEAARPYRYANVSDDCPNCADFMRRCQGGCMAVKRHAAAELPRLPQPAASQHCKGSDHATH